MTFGWSRTVIAAVLTAAGVVVPCSAWYFSGSRAAIQQASRLEEWPRRQASREAASLAVQVASRLEALRQSESRRPFVEYFSDDRAQRVLGDCAAVPTIESPLAEGPVDPLIWAHFQIDEVGVVTMPTLPGASLDPRRRAVGADADSIQGAILNELECASSEHLAALRRRPPGDDPPREWTSPQGLVTVGPFSWHTAVIESASSLVALREVATPTAVLTQGFVVPGERLDGLLDGAPFPARIRPGRPSGETGALVPLQGDLWSVNVDASQAQATAAAEAARVRGRFRGMFAIGTIAACLAGALVVLLVHQTDRVARQRSRFAASAAHELRTPLAGLRLYGEMLAEGRGDAGRRQEYARRVADEAERLGRVVSNVLGYSKLQRGGLAVAAREGDLEPAVRDSVARLRHGIELAGARVELRVEQAVPRAYFDPDALHQIVQNLLDNAAKFNRDAEDRTIRVTLSAPGGRPTLEVLDRGRGVEPSMQNVLFRPFVHHPDPDATAGLGIGLSLVRALARAQGAEVSHLRPPGGGAAFAVRFEPADRPDSPAPACC